MSDQDFRAVLVIAGRKSPSDIIRSEQAVAETVPCLGMLLLIPLQVFPKVLAECVLLIDLIVTLKDIAKHGPFGLL